MYDIKQHVINEFSSELTQKIYKKEALDGLWPSEEILTEKYFKQKSSVLDLGCGTGRTTIPLFKKGHKVTGVDITPLMIENAKIICSELNLDIKYNVGDACSLKFKDNYFDNVLFSYNGITQIPGNKNRVAAFKEINRVLKPGGFFIFTANIRVLKGYLLLWTRQWLKMFILKPLGLNIPELDFGDLFFKDRNRNKQYIHIPGHADLLNIIHKTGFVLIEANDANKIKPNKNSEINPRFYICKKS